MLDDLLLVCYPFVWVLEAQSVSLTKTCFCLVSDVIVTRHERKKQKNVNKDDKLKVC